MPTFTVTAVETTTITRETTITAPNADEARAEAESQDWRDWETVGETTSAAIESVDEHADENRAANPPSRGPQNEAILMRAIADNFLQRLRQQLTPTAWREMVTRNAGETNASICHSHDFCDANMVMAAAFTANGIEPDVDDEAVCTLWRQAWDIAVETMRKERAATPLWAHEFGRDYAVPDAITHATGLCDTSWHNDACPTFMVEGDWNNRGCLWVEHVDPAQRETPGTKRFSVTDADDKTVFESETDVEGALAALWAAFNAVELTD